ncbi:MAG: hypothetical protein JWQ01_2362 [Massilia sp.]|jgi:hypothetical protein|nr:hypothetical protein [Massilia sp.]
MAGEIVTKASRFYCVSLEPDICKTPIGASTIAVPYVIKGEFAEATGVSANITSNGEPVVIHASTVIPTVTGDEKGTAKGVKSQTVGKRVQHDQKSSSVSFNGERAVRVGDTVFMNDRNTIGRVFERPTKGSEHTRQTSPLLGSAAPSAGGHAYPAPPPTGSMAAQAALERLAAAFAQAVGSSGLIPPNLLNRVPGTPTPVRSAIATPGISPAASALGGRASLPAGVDGGSSRGRGGGPESALPQGPRQYSPRSIGSTAALRQEFPEFPGWAADILMKNRVRVLMVRDSVVEAFPQLRGVWPRNYPAGQTYDQVAGVCLDDGSAVAIAQSGKFLSRSFDMPFHELAHAVDIAARFSRSEKFIAAWGKDYHALGSDYFRGVLSGHSEAFAEGFARYYKRVPGTPASWPNISRYFEELDSCMSQGIPGC